MSGTAAKLGFRYQDLCAMYFALDSMRRDTSFEYIYCEQGKLDFELWGTTNFSGFQVKTNPTSLTAAETNKIFLFYLNKSVRSGKSTNIFHFVFAAEPSNSLGHLFTFTRNGGRGVKYTGHVKKFIDTALNGVPIVSLPIHYFYFDHDQIQRMVFAICSEILTERLKTTEDIGSEIVRSFIARLRDEIDRISCDADALKRVYSPAEVSALVDKFLVGVRLERSRVGRRTVEITLPEDIAERALDVRLTIPRQGGVGAVRDGNTADETHL